jgi:general secretion pathway protein H
MMVRASSLPRQLRRVVASRGFTLLELLLVLLLLGLAYGLAGPMFGDRPAGLDVQTATRQIAAGLRKARDTAVTQGRDAVLTLDVEARTFSVTGDPRHHTLPKPLSYTIYTASSETLTERLGSIRFHPDGSSTGGRVTASTGKGVSMSVDIDWLTGRAKVL